MQEFKIPNWHQLDKESCELIHKEAKDFFEEAASESEELTNKAVKIASFLATIIAFVAGVALKEKFALVDWQIGVIVVCSIPFLICGYNCFALLQVKMGRYRGISPGDWDYEAITDKENETCRFQATFASAMFVLESNSRKMVKLNMERQSNYTLALANLFLSIISTGVLIGIIFQS